MWIVLDGTTFCLRLPTGLLFRFLSYEGVEDCPPSVSLCFVPMTGAQIKDFLDRFLNTSIHD